MRPLVTAIIITPARAAPCPTASWSPVTSTVYILSEQSRGYWEMLPPCSSEGIGKCKIDPTFIEVDVDMTLSLVHALDIFGCTSFEFYQPER